MFITFEGIEGCGKSTQAKLLYEWLKENGYKALLTREPGGTEAAEEIRNFILKHHNEKFPAFAELCLYIAARGFHVENLIKPSLQKGIIVICDRFSDSTLAYQGYGRGLPIHLITSMNKEATGDIEPDITFLLDVPVEVGLSRIKAKKKDRLEEEPLQFHQRVREGFLKIAEENPDRIVVIDGTKEKGTIFSEVLNQVVRRL
ncbi:dTMP kinase [Phorcysia thermohydrogeniphila]|uniref:Thymidylate kinase n=1 Tax=Phorcysia thermohydrogeniphila TaxID=936138 RepID=A0A4R1G9Q0_9BACT|nr:dTMP kinase [Phorcysia thermohydrogeniphila]TCK03363.1 dTMP kinase [Phorcysia thermohydrogeniphila]